MQFLKSIFRSKQKRVKKGLINKTKYTQKKGKLISPKILPDKESRE